MPTETILGPTFPVLKHRSPKSFCFLSERSTSPFLMLTLLDRSSGATKAGLFRFKSRPCVRSLAAIDPPPFPSHKVKKRGSTCTRRTARNKCEVRAHCCLEGATCTRLTAKIRNCKCEELSDATIIGKILRCCIDAYKSGYWEFISVNRVGFVLVTLYLIYYSGLSVLCWGVFAFFMWVRSTLEGAKILGYSITVFGRYFGFEKILF